MSVSIIGSSSAGSAFNISITSTYETVLLTNPQPAGAYTFTSALSNITMDLYFYSATGQLVASTNLKSINPSISFSKIVILGGTVGDVLSFTFQQTYGGTAETAETTAGPVILSTSPTSLPNASSTTVVTGLNFPSNITATFTGTDSVARTPASIVYGSATSLVIQRPAIMPISAAPYTLSVTNPSVTPPTGSTKNTISNLTAGSLPTWITSTSLGSWAQGTPLSITLQASDTNPGGSITYSVVSGSLPTGVTFNTSTGIISGTPIVATPANYTITIAATNAGGNAVNRTFTLGPDAGPVWVSSGALTTYGPSAYSYQLTATDDSGTAPTYSLASGSLPTGLSLSSSGLISGSAYSGTTSGTSTFTVTATDANGTSTTSGTLTIGYSFFGVGSSFTFTTTGLSGPTGPTLGQLQSAYSATSWAQSTSNLTLGSYNGYQAWIVPATGTYEFLVKGAFGGSTGAAADGGAAIIRGRTTLTAGETIIITCGQTQGPSQNTSWWGGNGGTFVVRNSGNIPLYVAGGGQNHAASNPGSNMAITTSGQNGSNGGVATAGTNGNGGSGNLSGGGGGGFFSAGGNSSYGQGGGGYNNGLVGGSGTSNNGSYGGFGGGGGGDGQQYGGTGASGGYSGGGGGTSTQAAAAYGGSYIVTGSTNVATSSGLYNGASTFESQGTIVNIGYSTSTSGSVLVTRIS